MSNIPIEIGPYEVTKSIEAVLNDHLQDALDQYNTAHGFLLVKPRCYWYYGDIERDFQTPGIGIELSDGVPILYSALGAKDVTYGCQVVMIMRLADVIDPSNTTDEKNLNYYRQAMRDYADAVGKTLETYMPAAEYQETSYVWQCLVAQAVGQVVFESSKSGDMFVACAIGLAITQRVRARTPVSAPPPTP